MDDSYYILREPGKQFRQNGSLVRGSGLLFSKVTIESTGWELLAESQVPGGRHGLALPAYLPTGNHSPYLDIKTYLFPLSWVGGGGVVDE